MKELITNPLELLPGARKRSLSRAPSGRLQHLLSAAQRQALATTDRSGPAKEVSNILMALIRSSGSHESCRNVGRQLRQRQLLKQLR